VRSASSDEKKLSIAVLSHTLPDRLIEQTILQGNDALSLEPAKRTRQHQVGVELGVEHTTYTGK
jgi:hypothetical protein